MDELINLIIRGSMTSIRNFVFNNKIRSIKESEKFPVFDAIIKKGDIRIVNFFLQQGIYTKNEMFDKVSLMICAKCGNTKLFKYIFERINLDTRIVINAYVEACENGNHNIVKYIDSRKFNLDLESSRALTVAASNGHYSIVKHLLFNGITANSNDCWPVIMAAKHDFAEVVKLLVKYGADITSRENLALKMAIRNKNEGLIEYLQELINNGLSSSAVS